MHGLREGGSVPTDSIKQETLFPATTLAKQRRNG